MNLITTATLPDHVQETVTLQGRCLNARHRRSQHDRAFYELHFADSHGSAVVQIWSGNMLYDKFREIDWEELPPIELVGRVIQLDHCLRVKAEEISVVSDSHICNGAQLIPSAWVPLAAREAHAWLVQFIDTMQSPSLRTFMTGLLLDSSIGIPFIRSRASVNNHHNYPGGLLVHSVQMARMIEALAHILGLSEEERLIAQIGALLHDLGKIHTVGAKSPRPMSPSHFRHESQTLLLVAKHLNDLHQHAPREAMLLNHVLDRLASSRSSMDSKFIGEDLIRHADYLSAANHASKSMVDVMKANINWLKKYK